MNHDQPLREQLQKILDWEDAHVNFDAAVEGMPPELAGARPDGFPHSAWQLLEHIRITQEDILDFCRNPDYEERSWPDDYWPATVAPPEAESWTNSIFAYVRDREALKQLCISEDIDLFATIPHGSGQTYLREILLVADHTSYHVGEIVVLRRQLGAWKTE